MSASKRPGIMLVRSRIHSPSTFSRTQYARWTQIHFKDLLDMPRDEETGSITHTLRFTASEPIPLGDQWDCPYFNTIHVEDVGVLHTEAYHDVSRRLDLENTRSLVE